MRFCLLFVGATENARVEKAGRSKMQGWKMQDWKTRHQTAGLENARLEKAVPNCRGGKCETGKRGTKTSGVENSGKGVYGQPNVKFIRCCSTTGISDTRIVYIKRYNVRVHDVLFLAGRK